MSTEKISLMDLGITFGLSIYGGLAQTFMNNRLQGRSRISIVLLLTGNGVIASFAGLLGMLLAKELGLSVYQTYMLSALAGYSGGKFLEQIELRVFEKFLKAPPDKEAGQ